VRTPRVALAFLDVVFDADDPLDRERRQSGLRADLAVLLFDQRTRGLIAVPRAGVA